jgi:hypothetical protein
MFGIGTFTVHFRSCLLAKIVSAFAKTMTHYFRIERKLRTQQYKNYIEFASDMRQMFTETYKYNNPDSPMVTAAGKLQKEFEVRFAKINFQERKPVRPGNDRSRIF